MATQTFDIQMPPISLIANDVRGLILAYPFLCSLQSVFESGVGAYQIVALASSDRLIIGCGGEERRRRYVAWAVQD